MRDPRVLDGVGETERDLSAMTIIIPSQNFPLALHILRR
jgi:hypothetical protein